jgi:hypothetical protein
VKKLRAVYIPYGSAYYIYILILILLPVTTLMFTPYAQGVWRVEYNMLEEAIGFTLSLKCLHKHALSGEMQ